MNKTLKEVAHSLDHEWITDKAGDVCLRPMIFTDGKREVLHAPDPVEFRPVEEAIAKLIKISHHHAYCKARKQIEAQTAQSDPKTAVVTLIAMCQHISPTAEDGRQSVNAIGEAVRQIDQDAASAVTRGYFLTIRDMADAVIAQATKLLENGTIR